MGLIFLNGFDLVLQVAVHAAQFLDVRAILVVLPDDLLDHDVELDDGREIIVCLHLLKHVLRQAYLFGVHAQPLLTAFYHLGLFQN